MDSSTQSTKVEIRDADSGELVARASAPHPPTAPPVSEQDPEAWWDALATCFHELGAHRNGVSAISVAGQQHGLVLADSSGEVLRPAKLWNDTTSAPQADRLVDELGPEGWANGCGSVPVASFTVTKLAWVLEHEPEVAERAAMVMLPHDYLTWRLSGRHVTDHGDASGTGWFDPTSGEYRADLLALVADPEKWMPRLPAVLAPGEPAGTLTRDAADALGLGAEVVVAPGSGDNMGAALGLGLGSGDVVMSLGTSGTIYAVSASGTNDSTGAVAGFADASGGFLPLVCTLNATKVTDTVASWLGTDAPGLAELALEAGEEPGPILIPYFDGERTPNLPQATGTFAGLTNETSRPQLARAAHDGVVCGLLAGLDALVAAGVDTDGRLLLIGGGARSSAYQQRVATLAGREIIVPDDDETVATGAAVQASAVSAGRPISEVTAAWGLGTGPSVQPGDPTPALAIRTRYSEAAETVT
ncbi:MAG: xylulokinase [Acidimicrobiales bacterium]